MYKKIDNTKNYEQMKKNYQLGYTWMIKIHITVMMIFTMNLMNLVLILYTYHKLSKELVRYIIISLFLNGQRYESEDD